MTGVQTCALPIYAADGQAHVAACDVTDGAVVRAMVAAMPVLDILVNNAGMNLPEPFVNITEDRLDRVVNLNMRSQFLVAQAAVRKMLEHPQRKARGLTDAALATLDLEGAERPWFLWLHYMDPHDPYFRHPYDGYGIARVANQHPSPELVAEMRELYRGEIEHLDANFEIGRAHV